MTVNYGETSFCFQCIKRWKKDIEKSNSYGGLGIEKTGTFLIKCFLICSSLQAYIFSVLTRQEAGLGKLNQHTVMT